MTTGVAAQSPPPPFAVAPFLFTPKTPPPKTELPRRVRERHFRSRLQPDHWRAGGHGHAERPHLEGRELAGTFVVVRERGVAVCSFVIRDRRGFSARSKNTHAIGHIFKVTHHLLFIQPPPPPPPPPPPSPSPPPHPKTNKQLVRLLLPPILVGTGVGLVLLYHIHSLWLKRVLGLIFLSVASYQIHGEVLRAKGVARPHTPRPGQLQVDGPERKELRFTATLLGLASGVLAGLFGTGGPPLMVLVALTDVDKDEWRASNAVIWFVDNVFRFFYLYAVQGQVRIFVRVPQRICWVAWCVLWVLVCGLRPTHMTRCSFPLFPPL